ncbi:phage tail protein [Roseovarius ramblicola]|uniref:Phage tail protein n=1 Tax=Roseovarius ramblicola TaxID=2022336 RepID=A0ABV5HZK8_9RHOB
MADVMLQLGAFQFGVDSAAYQSLSRTATYKWAAQSRVGTADALQFTGLGRESIDLRGVIYPEYRGGDGQPGLMRLQALLGVPLPLVSGQGRVLGLWVVEGVREAQAVFRGDGAPRRQEFDLRLRRYDGGLRALLPF